MFQDLNLVSSLLSRSCAKTLGEATRGALAYIRCLDSEIVEALISSGFKVAGWRVLAVGAPHAASGQVISADEAVDIRERKEVPTLLLVIPNQCGAGMDGIYSAAREISEKDLLSIARNFAEDGLPPQEQENARVAVQMAKRASMKRPVSLWQELAFYVSSASQGVGPSLYLLGLWPMVKVESAKEDIELSAQLSERLLNGTATRPIAEVIGSLMLQNSSKEQVDALRGFLHYVARSVRHDCLERLRDTKSLWLGNLHPGFMGTSLADLEIVSWRGTDGLKIHKWSGLELDGTQERPVFVIDPEAPSKFRIRWKSKPETLEPNSVVYFISIITTSDEELVPEKTISHKAKNVQECVFSTDEFGELESGGKWVVKVSVRALRNNKAEEGDDYLTRETEEFVIVFGARDVAGISSSVGSEVRALSEVAVQLQPDELHEALERTQEDGKGYIILRGSSRFGRVRRLPLVKNCEESWRDNHFSPGRWKIRINADGVPYGPPEFVSIDLVGVPEPQQQEFRSTSIKLGEKLLGCHGICGAVLSELTEIEPYLHAWLNACRQGPSSLILCNTIEVVSLSNKPIGIIVLPTHPTRLAWHYAYDTLVAFVVRKSEVAPNAALDVLRKLDGSFVPLFLPPLAGGEPFVYGDSVGFHCAAMVRAGDPEPQASISLMAQALAAGGDMVTRTCGSSISSAIAREVLRYAKLHPAFESLRIAALRSGDGLVITRALGEALASQKEEAVQSDDFEQEAVRSRFQLDLHSSEDVRKSSLRVVGRFISEMTARRRSGAGAPPEIDRWAQESYRAINGLTLPRLSWAKKANEIPESPVHLSVGFDMFQPTIEVAEQPVNSHPFEVYGLCPTILRQYHPGAISEWHLTAHSPSYGQKHPAGDRYTDLITETQMVLMTGVSRALDGKIDSWPLLKTRVSNELRYTLQRLHEASDWVISVGNNGGVEFFDSPQDDAETYDTFIIDLVPERPDLQGLQLVTSTSKLDEVRYLLDAALRQMGLSNSSRNCTFLLTQLKALSGRLAMRLTSESSKQELIALALVRSSCIAGPKDIFPDLSKGFFVPLDDLPEMSASRGLRGRIDGGRRADLLYVSCTEALCLKFVFVEVKFRLNLQTARSEATLRDIRQQTTTSRLRWIEAFFRPGASPLASLVCQRRLAQVLKFYLEKSRRHGLGEDAFDSLSSGINRLYTEQIEIESEGATDIGFVFCPDFDGPPELVEETDQTKIYVMGSSQLPDQAHRRIEQMPLFNTEVRPDDRSLDKDTGGAAPLVSLSVISQRDLVEEKPVLTTPTRVTQEGESAVETIGAEISVSLGDSAEWKPSIRGNPHLLVVGKSGMGKSYAVARVVKQAIAFGVRPVVFDYHGDLQSSLSVVDRDVRQVNLLQGLGFNPLAVLDDNPQSFLNNAGRIRDIFAGIFPEMGDVQLEAIRAAIKQSYKEVGFGGSQMPTVVPEFSRFFDIIKESNRPPRGLVERLEELSDYGLFRSNSGPSSVLDFHGPIVIDLHSIQNDALQGAFASFQLFNIYQSMFRLGAAHAIRHLVVFDEAHRASKLKLVPLLAKECRKYGISLLLASQEVRDFHPSVFANVGSFLVLGINEPDAKVIAKHLPVGGDAKNMVERFKALQKYHAYFISENTAPRHIKLSST